MIWGLSKESPIEPLRSGQRHFAMIAGQLTRWYPSASLAVMRPSL
jgi:hypothetical protein